MHWGTDSQLHKNLNHLQKHDEWRFRFDYFAIILRNFLKRICYYSLTVNKFFRIYFISIDYLWFEEFSFLSKFRIAYPKSLVWYILFSIFIISKQVTFVNMNKISPSFWDATRLNWMRFTSSESSWNKGSFLILHNLIQFSELLWILSYKRRCDTLISTIFEQNE